MKAKRIYWTVCAGVFAVGALAAATTPWLDYTFNLTNCRGQVFSDIPIGEVRSS